MQNNPTSIRTPAALVRGLGSIRSGTHHFWLSRVTALANIPLSIGFLVIALMLAGKDRAGAISVVSHPLAAIVLLGFILSICVHMRLGMQVIIEDYVHSEATKIVLLVLNTLFAAGIALASAYAILKIGLA